MRGTWQSPEIAYGKNCPHCLIPLSTLLPSALSNNFVPGGTFFSSQKILSQKKYNNFYEFEGMDDGMIFADLRILAGTSLA